MTNTYIESGSSIRVYDSTVKTHAALPVGTYKTRFDQREGFSLQRVEDLVVGNERIYGGRDAKVEKMFSAYERSQRSLGVMLSGDKGQGKSLFVRMLAERAIEEDTPVVLVTEDADGIAEFLDTLDECLIIFDEFEKTFPMGSKRNEIGNRQHQFLGLFDGLSNVNLDDMIEKFKKSDKIACFLAVHPPVTYHLADINDDGKVNAFVTSDRSEIWINGGFFLLKPAIFDYMNDGDELVVEPFARLIKENKLMAYRHEGFWRSMDTLRDRQVLEDMIEKGDMPWRVNGDASMKPR